MEFWKRVTIQEPGGKPVHFDMKFKRFRRRDLTDLFSRYDGETDDMEEALQRDVDMVMEIAVAWRNAPVDGDWSRDAVEELLDLYPSAALDIVHTFREAHFPSAEKKR